MTDINSGTPERTESPEDKFTAEIPEQEEESALLDAALGDVAVTEDQDNLLDDTGDASQIEDPVRPVGMEEYVVGEVDYSIWSTPCKILLLNWEFNEQERSGIHGPLDLTVTSLNLQHCSSCSRFISSKGWSCIICTNFHQTYQLHAHINAQRR